MEQFDLPTQEMIIGPSLESSTDLQSELPHLGEGWVVTAVPAATLHTARLLVREAVAVAGGRERGLEIRYIHV